MKICLDDTPYQPNIIVTRNASFARDLTLGKLNMVKLLFYI